MRPICWVSLSPMNSQLFPPFVVLYRPAPGEMEFLVFGSPVP